MQGGALGTHPRWRPRSTSAPIGSVSPWGVYLYMSMLRAGYSGKDELLDWLDAMTFISLRTAILMFDFKPVAFLLFDGFFILLKKYLI